MTHVLVIRPPEKLRNGGWVLASDLRLGGDTVRLGATIGPKTAAWLRGRMRRGVDWARHRLGPFLDTRDDWARFGSLGKMASDIAMAISESPSLESDPLLDAACRLYLTYQTGNPQARSMVERIFTDSEKGVAQASEAAIALSTLSQADNLLSSEDCVVRIGDWAYHSEAAPLLRALRALAKHRCGPGNLDLVYDGEAIYHEPSKINDAIGYIGSAFAYRNFLARPRVAISEVANTLNRASKRDCECQDRIGAMPYYGAGYNPDDLDPPRNLGWDEPADFIRHYPSRI